jgi:hypothetical protein
MEAILGMIQDLVTKFFGNSAMPVIRNIVGQILAIVGSIFSRFAPSAA